MARGELVRIEIRRVQKFLTQRCSHREHYFGGIRVDDDARRTIK